MRSAVVSSATGSRRGSPRTANTSSTPEPATVERVAVSSAAVRSCPSSSTARRSQIVCRAWRRVVSALARTFFSASAPSEGRCASRRSMARSWMVMPVKPWSRVSCSSWAMRVRSARPAWYRTRMPAATWRHPREVREPDHRGERGDPHEEEPAALGDRGWNGEVDRGAVLVPDAVLVGRDDVEAIGAGAEVGVEGLAPAAGLLPSGVAADQLYRKRTRSGIERLTRCSRCGGSSSGPADAGRGPAGRTSRPPQAGGWRPGVAPDCAAPRTDRARRRRGWWRTRVCRRSRRRVSAAGGSARPCR